MGIIERSTRRLLRLQMAAGIVVCPVVGIALIVTGIGRAITGGENAAPVLVFTLVLGLLLIAGSFVCLHRFRSLGNE